MQLDRRGGPTVEIGRWFRGRYRLSDLRLQAFRLGRLRRGIRELANFGARRFPGRSRPLYGSLR